MRDEHIELVPQQGEEPPAAHPNVRLWLRLIGDFEAQTRTGASALPVSKKARALLSLIAAHMPQALRRDAAASLLWSGKPRDQAANSLRQALRELQIALAVCGGPPLLLIGNGRLAMQSDSVWIDINDSAAIKWKVDSDGAVGPLLLCQNLQGLDVAYDTHLERLWKNIVFQQAFVPNAKVEADAYPFGRRPLTETEAGADFRDRAGSGFSEEQSEFAQPISRLNESVHGQGWRIAVLPFRSLGSPLEGGLSLGMAEEISAALARFRMPRLIATGSFWDGVGQSVDALVRCRAYNLDYVITGTIQTSGPRVRVTVNLLDVSMDFEVIWASRFEGSTQDLFSLQDTIASQTVAQIDPELLQRQQFRGDSIQAPKAAAHQLVLTAIQSIYRPDCDRFMTARDVLQEACKLDPEYAAGHAWLAYWYVVGITQGWLDDPRDAAVRAGRAAERAVLLDPLDARGLTIAGHVKAFLLHDLESALALHSRAIVLNPNLPIAWALNSWAHVYNGEHRKALDYTVIAESLSPTDPHIFITEHAAMTARFMLRDLEMADKLASDALERRPRHATALKIRAAVLGHLGRLSEAKACIDGLYSLGLTINVRSIINRPPFRQADREYFEEGLRLAGVPD